MKVDAVVHYSSGARVCSWLAYSGKGFVLIESSKTQPKKIQKRPFKIEKGGI